jgi:hypothetical protein
MAPVTRVTSGFASSGEHQSGSTFSTRGSRNARLRDEEDAVLGLAVVVALRRPLLGAGCTVDVVQDQVMHVSAGDVRRHVLFEACSE